MSLYTYIFEKNPDGTPKLNKDGKQVKRMIMVDDPAKLSKQPIVTPPAVTVAEAVEHGCKVCGKPFRTAGVLAIHFNRDHKDLVEDKSTWRKYDTHGTGSGNTH